MKMAKRMGYRETLDWLLDNEDLTCFIGRSEDPSATVACALAADIFGKTDEELRVALLARNFNRRLRA
jgi:hypothetical protein